MFDLASTDGSRKSARAPDVSGTRAATEDLNGGVPFGEAPFKPQGSP